MYEKPDLLNWLEQLSDLGSPNLGVLGFAYVSPKDAIAALERIRAHAMGLKAPGRRTRLKGIEDFPSIRSGVTEFLMRAAAIVEPGDDGRLVSNENGELKGRIVRMAQAWMGSNSAPDCWIGFSLWRLALEMPVEKWRMYKRRKCDRRSCDKGRQHLVSTTARHRRFIGASTRGFFEKVSSDAIQAKAKAGRKGTYFFDKRWVMRGKQKRYCSTDCQLNRNR